MAATAAINTPERAGNVISFPAAANAIIFLGALVALNADGNAVPAADTAGLRVVGRAEEDIDNTGGAAGDVTVNVKRGVFRYANSGTDAVDANDKGKLAFVEDDSTVCEAGGTNKVIAGRVLDVDSDGVWIDTSEGALVPSAVTLTSTNGVAAAASANLAALAAETEKIGDDVRAIHAALVAQGILI